MDDRISFAFVVFWYSLTYNLVRFVLLAKTKSLELSAASAGFAPTFSLEDRVWKLEVRNRKLTWQRLLVAAQVGFAINVLLVLYHLWHFLHLRLVP